MDIYYDKHAYFCHNECGVQILIESIYYFRKAMSIRIIFYKASENGRLPPQGFWKWVYFIRKQIFSF